MKKQVQKIKENKGFSMIELIIVVAIMAILVGIIGAALIPYMEKSRASKDKSALDSLYTAFASAIAETEDASKVTGSGGDYGLTADGQAKVESLLDGDIDTLLGKMKSKQFKGITSSSSDPALVFFYNVDSNGIATYGVKVTSSTYTDVIIDNTGAEYPIGVKKTTTN